MLKSDNESQPNNVETVYNDELQSKVALLEKAFDAQEVSIKALVELNEHLKEMLAKKK